MKFCECCGQRMPEMRMGVRITPRTAELFDLVKNIPGITQAELQARMNIRAQRNVAVYVHQLNEYLEPSGWRVRGHRGWGYRLERVNNTVDNPLEVVYRPRLPRLQNGQRKISQ